MAKKICPSDFTHQIAIQSRELLPDNTSPDFKLEFDAGIQTWAMIKTTRGREFIGDVNQAEGVTHIFTIRHMEGITSQHWVLYDGRRFDILDVENIDEKRRYIRLRCNERGTDELKRNSW